MCFEWVYTSSNWFHHLLLMGMSIKFVYVLVVQRLSLKYGMYCAFYDKGTKVGIHVD